MAQIQDRKRNFYSNVQSIKEEACAPTYLESAGDLLIKDLARKQVHTATSLQEQLNITQEFEVGTELKPCNQSGVTTLQEFKKAYNEEDLPGNPSDSNFICENEDIEELKRRTGLTRHELELSLSEKPNSEISKLYKFALKNKRKRNEEEKDDLKSKLVSHPINYLKEIEEEYFGHLKTGNAKEDSLRNDLDGNLNESGNEVVISNEKTTKKKKKHRKRKKREAGSVQSSDLNTNSNETKDNAIKIKPDGETKGESNSYRPSLWDVKDVRKLCQSKVQTCEPKPKTLYTIKDGKIVKLDSADAGS